MANKTDMIPTLLKSSGKDRQSTSKQIITVNYGRYYGGDEHGAGIKDNRVGMFLRRDGIVIVKSHIDRNIQTAFA